jgi:hypothetical protein
VRKDRGVRIPPRADDRERPREFATRDGESLFVSRRVKP